MGKKRVLAFDLGGSSGRAMLARFDGQKIELKEVHRFDNEPVMVHGTLYWDVLRLFHEIKQGIVQANNAGGFDSIGIDTWGVDFGLLSKEGALLENPVHYRDRRTAGMMDAVCKKIGAERLYQLTGNQLMEINTIFQLYSIAQNRPELLNSAETVLLMPDLFNFMLTGRKYAECSIASTTQLMDPVHQQWNPALMEQLGLRPSLFPPIVKSGTVVGTLTEELCRELETEPKTVISVASHDTASAVAAIPAETEDFIFISCGTWSLFGTELPSPIINEKSRRCNLTNEIGYGGTTTFLKNIIGLWLIQETRRQFKRIGKAYSYADMEQMAKASKPFACLIDPDSPVFVPPGDIPGRIRDFCQKTGQYVPQTDGEIVRCIYESIAMKYQYTFEQIQNCTGKAYSCIYMAGGGTKDRLLCQMTASAANRKVIAGPSEATALGNAAVQLIALGCILNLSEARKIVKNSFEPVTYLPENHQLWEQHFEKFRQLLETEQ